MYGDWRRSDLGCSAIGGNGFVFVYCLNITLASLSYFILTFIMINLVKLLIVHFYLGC